MLVYGTALSKVVFSGLTPRFEAMVEAAIAKISPAPEGCGEWEIESIDYDRVERRVVLGLNPVATTIRQVLDLGLVEGGLLPFTQVEAAALGAFVGVARGGEEQSSPTLWWGLKEDSEEIIGDFPHLCGK
jgi:hypothetical protein